MAKCFLYTQNIVCDRCDFDSYAMDFVCPFYKTAQDFRVAIFNAYFNQFVAFDVSMITTSVTEYKECTKYIPAEEKPRPNYRFKPMSYRKPQQTKRPMRVARSCCGHRK